MSGFSKVLPFLSDSRHVEITQANKSGPVVVHWAIPFAHLRKKVTLHLTACGADGVTFGHETTRPDSNPALPVLVRRVLFIWVTRGVKELSHTVKDVYVIPKVPPPPPA